MLRAIVSPVTVLVACCVMAGCGSPPQEGPATQEPASKTGVAPPELDDAVTPPAEVAATAPSVVQEPGYYANGDLSVRVGTAALTVLRARPNGETDLVLGATLTLENRGTAPVALIGSTNGRPSIMLDNGVAMRINDIEGLKECSRSMETCLAGTPDDFIEIGTGNTATVNLTFRGGALPGQKAGLAGVEKGSLTMQLYMVQDGMNRTVNVSIPVVPVTNNIG